MVWIKTIHPLFNKWNNHDYSTFFKNICVMDLSIHSQPYFKKFPSKTLPFPTIFHPLTPFFSFFNCFCFIFSFWFFLLSFYFSPFFLSIPSLLLTNVANVKKELLCNWLQRSYWIPMYAFLFFSFFLFHPVENDTNVIVHAQITSTTDKSVYHFDECPLQFRFWSRSSQMKRSVTLSSPLLSSSSLKIPETLSV